MGYIKFDILPVAGKCGVQIKEQSIGRNEVRANCPFCNDRHYHLSFNIQKNRYRCNRCDESGNAVSLYAKIFNITNLEAFEELSANNVYRLPKNHHKQEIKCCTQADLQVRHNVYFDFLQMLKLTDSHRQNLQKRGLPNSYIEKFMYKSLPLDRSFRQSVLKELKSKHNLLGVPGFYTDNYGEWQIYLMKQGGILIPVCDKDGYIQGLQIRLDGVTNDKFRWFSSNYYKDGTKASTWIHVVGDISSDTAFVTEGPLKADIASILSGGKLFIAVAGVNCIDRLPTVLKSLNVIKVIEVYDMDKVHNENVAKAVLKLKNTLKQLNIEYLQYSWDSNFKGIDDYLLFRKMCQQKQQISGNLAA